MSAWSRQERPAADSGTITWAETDVPGDNTDTVADRGKAGPNPVGPAVQANYSFRPNTQQGIQD